MRSQLHHGASEIRLTYLLVRHKQSTRASCPVSRLDELSPGRYPLCVHVAYGHPTELFGLLGTKGAGAILVRHQGLRKTVHGAQHTAVGLEDVVGRHASGSRRRRAINNSGRLPLPSVWVRKVTVRPSKQVKSVADKGAQGE